MKYLLAVLLLQGVVYEKITVKNGKAYSNGSELLINQKSNYIIVKAK